MCYSKLFQNLDILSNPFLELQVCKQHMSMEECVVNELHFINDVLINPVHCTFARVGMAVFWGIPGLL